MSRAASDLYAEDHQTTLRVVGVIFTWIGVSFLVLGTLLLLVGLYGLPAGMVSVRPPSGAAPVAPDSNESRMLQVLGAAAGERHSEVAPSSNQWKLLQVFGGILSVFWSLGFSITGLQFLAMGSLCRLAIQVEANTRLTARYLEKLSSRVEAPPREGGVSSIFVS